MNTYVSPKFMTIRKNIIIKLNIVIIIIPSFTKPENGSTFQKLK